jgi:hypothetical protein
MAIAVGQTGKRADQLVAGPRYVHTVWSGNVSDDALLKSVARREVDIVAAWSVDRLGRSLTDLLDFLRELHAKGVDLFLLPSSNGP